VTSAGQPPARETTVACFASRPDNDPRKDTVITKTETVSTAPGISPAELAVMEDAARAFRQKFAGVRTEYRYSGPAQGTPNHSHLWHAAADRFAVLAQPHRAAG
jgi:hypothetical protein